MKYQQITTGTFLARPNRFIAYVDIEGKTEKCHVKNTGRCKELLIPGAIVYLEKRNQPNRKTQYDVIAVQKGKLLINMDSQAPNKVYAEWAKEHIEKLRFFKSEVFHGDSRFDFYYETDTKQTFVEVKGVTLEQDGVVKFPDAPTERGVKHLRGLMQCVKEGYGAEVVFVVQMEEAIYFCPNEETHAAFAKTLREAVEAGVTVRVFTCKVLPDTLEISREMEARI